MPLQSKIDKFCQPSPGPKPTTSLRRSAAGGEATPGSRPPLPGRRLSMPRSSGSSTPTGTDNPGSTGVSTPAETSNAPTTTAPSPSDSGTTPSRNAGPDPSPRPPTVAPPMASASNPRAGSPSASKRKRRQPGSPRGLGSPTPRPKQKREDSAENNDDTLQEITNLVPERDCEEGQQSTVDVGANCPPGSSTPAEDGAGSAHPTTDQPTALPSTGVTTGSPSPARSCVLENDESLQEITNKSKQNDRSAEVTGEEGHQSAVDVGANCFPGSSTPAEDGAGSAHPTTDQPAALPATGVTTGSPSPARSCGLENDESLQVPDNKRSNKEESSSQVPDEKKEIAASVEVKFQLKVALTGLQGDFLITAPGNQPIRDALQGDTRLEKIKKRLPKIHLHPCGRKNPIEGEPNLGSPCSVIKDGKFEAKLGKVQILNKYSDDELKFSDTERHKIYLNVRDRKSKAPWLTKENPNTFDSPILIDCLPGDTLLLALCRDTRIRKDRMRYTQLIWKGSTGDVNINVTDKCHFYKGKTFACHVQLKTSKDSNDEWEKVQHDSNSQTMSKIGSSSDAAASDTEGSKGTPDPQEVKISKDIEDMLRRSRARAKDLLKLDFEKKKSRKDEKKEALIKFCQNARKKYHTRPGTRILLTRMITNLAKSVGIVVKNNHPYGTCFRLGTRYVLTNKHVVRMAIMLEIGGDAFVEMGWDAFVEMGGDAFVEFNYEQKFTRDQERIWFKVKRVVCTSQNDELDFSLLELDVPDDQSDKLPPGLGHLIQPTSEGKNVTIIGHPNGGPKEMDPSCPIVSPDDTPLSFYVNFYPALTGSDYFPEVNYPGRVTYKSVFAHGSSGSPGFTNDGKLVVMHTCGFPVDGESVLEQGASMKAIKDYFQQHEPALCNDLFSPPPESMEVE